MNRLQERYKKEIVPSLVKDLGLENIMQCPRIEKIVINMVFFFFYYFETLLFQSGIYFYSYFQ